MLFTVFHVKNPFCVDMGKGDVTRHCDPTSESIHNKNVKAGNKQRKISGLLQSSDTNKDVKVTKAEILHTNFIVQHNIPSSVADHLSKVGFTAFLFLLLFCVKMLFSMYIMI